MAAKIFEVGDVLPATTQLRIYIEGITGYNGLTSNYICSNESYSNDGGFYMRVHQLDPAYDLVIKVGGTTVFTNDVYNPVNYVIVDVSSLAESDRTIRYNDFEAWSVTWEDVYVAPSGFSITYEENGGSTVTDLTEQTALPTPLPTTTKANHVFAGWYYDNLFTQKAIAGDELTTNVALYAKWYTPTTWCEDIADAIREKEGSSGNIKHVDFADRVKNIQGAKELTQAQYDALSTKDSNTYYLING